MTTAYNRGRGKGGRGPGLTAELLQQTLICGLMFSRTNATLKQLHQNFAYCHAYNLSVQTPSLLLPFLAALSLPYFFIRHTVASFILLKPFISSSSNLALCPIRKHPRPTAIIDLKFESHYNCMTDYTVALFSEQPFLNIFPPTVAAASSLHVNFHWVIYSHVTLPL